MMYKKKRETKKVNSRKLFSGVWKVFIEGVRKMSTNYEVTYKNGIK